MDGQGMAWYGMAWRGEAGTGWARPGLAWHWVHRLGVPGIVPPAVRVEARMG